MPWEKFEELNDVLKKYDILPELKDCPDCKVKPGEIHNPNCDIQRCSVCGGQRLQCNCKKHDPAFSRWTGFWPGQLECIALGMLAIWKGNKPVSGWVDTPVADLNRFMVGEYPRLFFVKPSAVKKSIK